ncbi:conserved hypothetical protein [Talaromyces stipitatus ATCC 10500]|uniref:Zn(2)-C6 fungal-type domain-containing protein n=2 Tax=Talaromyces stipitatus (strain ATCC 10500 / CBS 375.48 / QM 6759 / NRRL 1006) TaxID=441959 RepID=B8MJ26_TALSN|nr:uncharacterized protein TSTA_051260 [Talaromyces stipitatus ATCC 10500]EED15690.1 conserved hypothetical protein [Talaromyces stipitatus ATCC 10500]
MPSRRQHLKSRHGCLTCKSRKVKRPVCSHCSRRKERCRYTEDAPNLSHNRLSHAYRRNAMYSSEGHLPAPLFTSLRNLEQILLHHFSSSVSLTLSDRSDFQEVWSHHVPRDSYDYPHLMHSILAVSALHLSQTANPENLADIRFYAALATNHHVTALSLLTPHVTGVTINNFDAMYATAMLVFLYALMTLSDSSCLSQHIVALSELAKGILAVRREGEERCEIKKSYLLRDYCAWDHPPPLPDGLHRTVRNIEHLVASLPETKEKTENKTEYQQAIRILRCTLNAVNLNREHPAMVFMWLTLVNRRYIELVESKDTMALMILGHYGICMLQVKDKWWSAKCGAYLVSAVHRILDN